MPTFETTDGRSYTTDDPIEVTRLRMSRKYTEKGVEPVTLADQQFHPEGQTAETVKAYIEQHPEDAARVISEEKAGKNRTSIVGG